MKYFPQDADLKKFIDHYWIVQDAQELFNFNKKIYGYPGIRSELIIPLVGTLDYYYLGKHQSATKAMMFSHLEGQFVWLPPNLKAFIIVQFKPKSLAAMLPFTNISPTEIIKNSVCGADELFGSEINQLINSLKNKPAKSIAEILDAWFFKRLNVNRNGFIVELFSSESKTKSILDIKKMTNYSDSTLVRYFKSETGLTPKKYQSLQRYKYAVEEIYQTQNNDWMYYVEKYNYYDQAHFIKEIKRYTYFTPSQLLLVPGLLHFRPF